LESRHAARKAAWTGCRSPPGGEALDGGDRLALQRRRGSGRIRRAVRRCNGAGTAGAESQPFFVPVRPACSSHASSREVRGSTVSGRCCLDVEHEVDLLVRRGRLSASGRRGPVRTAFAGVAGRTAGRRPPVAVPASRPRLVTPDCAIFTSTSSPTLWRYPQLRGSRLGALGNGKAAHGRERWTCGGRGLKAVVGG